MSDDNSSLLTVRGMGRSFGDSTLVCEAAFSLPVWLREFGFSWVQGGFCVLSRLCVS